MTDAVDRLLSTLLAEADGAAAAEAVFRREIKERLAVLERERAFAFRRVHLMRALTDALESIEKEEAALLRAKSVLREELGWTGESEARNEVVERFGKVAAAVFAALRIDPDTKSAPALLLELTAFEKWYEATHTGPFWALFEDYVPETPVVDF
ncbi:MAG: hypothetical protein K6U10_13690 [Acidobacteriia bacterium]|nr:hypothetical protein [Methyloceanibacter sp.]MCL6492855.1 hypothetical protein [Terriglobia bacterium]